MNMSTGTQAEVIFTGYSDVSPINCLVNSTYHALVYLIYQKITTDQCMFD